MNSTYTVKTPAHALASSQPAWAATLLGALKRLATLAFGPMDAQAERAENIRQLLALADSYAETQPSYAADLRAAAMSQLRAD